MGEKNRIHEILMGGNEMTYTRNDNKSGLKTKFDEHER